MPRADAAEHEPEHRQAREVDLVVVVTEGDVVAEHCGDLGGVSDTADPREGGDVIEGVAVVELETDVFAQASGDHPGAQHMLHRLAQPEIGREREGTDQFGQRDARVLATHFHGTSVRTRSGRSELSVCGVNPGRRRPVSPLPSTHRDSDGGHHVCHA